MDLVHSLGILEAEASWVLDEIQVGVDICCKIYDRMGGVQAVSNRDPRQVVSVKNAGEEGREDAGESSCVGVEVQAAVHWVREDVH